jgi:hypothetical protein
MGCCLILFKIGVQLLNIVVLARLIPPSEYGLMAMALVVTNFATLVRDLGTSAAIIQRRIYRIGLLTPFLAKCKHGFGNRSDDSNIIAFNFLCFMKKINICIMPSRN